VDSVLRDEPAQRAAGHVGLPPAARARPWTLLSPGLTPGATCSRLLRRLPIPISGYMFSPAAQASDLHLQLHALACCAGFRSPSPATCSRLLRRLPSVHTQLAL